MNNRTGMFLRPDGTGGEQARGRRRNGSTAASGTGRSLARLIRVIPIFIVVFLALTRIVLAQGSHVKVVILPFDMHSKTDISATRRNVMNSMAESINNAGAEIAGIEELKELVLKGGVAAFDEAKAFELSGKVRADFAVLGSITRLGNYTTVDWRILDLASRTTLSFYSKSSGSESELADRIKEAARPMYERMTSAVKEKPAVRSGAVDRIAVAGNRRVDTEAIRKKITSKVGEPFSPDDIKEDIRAVYSTGFFDDVSADLSDTASGKVLTFTVKEMPFIKKIELRGNKEVKEEKIKEAITIKENTALERTALGENSEKIRALYAEEGYYLAAVTPVVESDGLEATVVFKIDEGPEVKVKRITIIGNKFFSSGDIKGLMTTNEVGLFSFLTQSGRFNAVNFQNDLAIIIGNYYDNGFINADIVDHRVLLSEDKKWFYITIAVTEDEQYRVGMIDFSGDILADKKELFEKIKIKTGEIFNRSKMSKDMETISDFYGDKGYAYADIKPATNINPVKKTIDVTFDIKKNEPVYVERIDITGNVKTRDKVVRRELEVEEGKLFSSTDLKDSRNNLRRLGYFEDVRIAQTKGTADDRMKLDVDVKERPTGAISVGMGYSSVDKLIGTASISQSNFMGTGIKLDISGTVSASSSRYTLGFTEPWLFDRPISAGFDLYNTEKDYTDFKIRKNGFDLRAGFPITKRYTRGYLTYKLEDVHIFDVANTAAPEIKDQAGTSTESSIRSAIKRDTRDDAFFPREGSVETLSVDFAGGPLGGTVYFIKYEGDAVKFFPLPWDTTFSLHGSVGYVQGYSGKTPPIYEKYFLGGINSIRGFRTRSISPKDPVTGDLVGGTTMAFANAEFLFPLFPKQSIKGVVFFDAGNSYKGRIDPGDLRTGAGAGIRWFSPIGPLRLELGFNLGRRPGEAREQWDFTIGTMF